MLMPLKKHFNYALQVFRLDEHAIKQLSKEATATTWGLVIIAIAGLSLGLGVLFTNTSLEGYVIIGAAILLILLSFIGISFLYLFSHLLGGKGSFTSYFRSYSHMYLFNILAIIPVIGLLLSSLIGIWQVVMAIYITSVVRQMPLAKAAVVVLVPIIILFIVITTSSLFFDLKVFLQYFFTFLQPVP